MSARSHITNTVPIIIRQSAIVLFFKIVLLETVFLIIFSIALVFLQIAYNILESRENVWVILFFYLVMQSFKSLIIMGVVLSWVRHYYELTPGMVIYKSRVFMRRSSSFKLQNIAIVDVDQSLLARIFNYGNIELKNTFMQEHFFLIDVPNPQKCVQLLKHCMMAEDTHPRK